MEEAGLEVEAVAGGGAEAEGAVVVAGALPRDARRLHGDPLDWMFEIPLDQYSAILPLGMVPKLLVSHST